MSDNHTKDILATEFDESFVEFMRNRMVMSFYKYGPLAAAYPEHVDAIGSMRDRMREYTRTGNKEYLVDAANFAMIEFMRPRHPDAFFRSTDTDGSIGRVNLKTGSRDMRSNSELARRNTTTIKE